MIALSRTSLDGMLREDDKVRTQLLHNVWINSTPFLRLCRAWVLQRHVFPLFAFDNQKNKPNTHVE
jgi:hypothetical protein